MNNPENEKESFSTRPNLDHEPNLAPNTIAGSANDGPFEIPVSTIGPYKLLREVGEGGMGTVWIAQQDHPVKRRVAVKLIKSGFGSREILQRFDAERQALALMNHPNIARILDAGTTETGQPYFVMELVTGSPLTTYCDQNRLSIDERLKLFNEVCSGVQHAHQKGIIHRDLKPGNIIVGMQDGQPVPKIIDFGLAKAIEHTQKLTDQSLFTGIGQILGTLKYMSPEQASLDSLDIDTRTDIYALGIILYELLTGSTPLDDSWLKGQAALKVLEFIRDKEPVKPSSKLSSSTAAGKSSITNERRTDSLRLNRILAGDLDWIVMKALEKDRARRYESASGFSADVQRYLNSEPVMARPPSLNYRVGKFVRKNRAGVIAASLVAATLLAGIVGTTWGLFRALNAESRAISARNDAQKQTEFADRARTMAEQETAAKEKAMGEKQLALEEEARQRLYAETVADIVENDFLALSSVEGQADFISETQAFHLNKDMTVRELLDRAAEKLNASTDLEPLIEARLRTIVGKSYCANGDATKGVHFYESALKIRQKQLGSDDPVALTSMNNLAMAFLQTGRVDKAIPMLENTLELMKSKLGPDHPDTITIMSNLATSYRDAGQLDRALPLLERTLELSKTRLGGDHLFTLMSMGKLAAGYIESGQLVKGLRLAEQSLELMKSKLGSDHPHTITSMSILASSYRDAGQLIMALPLLEQSLEWRMSKLGSDHPDTLISMTNLALGYWDADQLDKALPLLEHSLELMKSKLGLDHPDTITVMSHLALGYREADQLDKALPLFEQSLELMKARFGADHPYTLARMNDLAVGCLDVGLFDKAMSLLEQTLELMKTKLGADHPDTLACMRNLAIAYSKAGSFNQAIPFFEEILKQSKQKLGQHHPDTLATMTDLGITYRNTGRIDKAIEVLEEVVTKVPKSPNLFSARGELRQAYIKAKRNRNFAENAVEDLRTARESYSSVSLELAAELASLGDDWLMIGDPVAAEPLLRECLEIRQQKIPEDWRAFNAEALLGAALLGQQKWDEALPLLEAGYAGLKATADTIPAAVRNDKLTQALDHLIALVTETKDEAALKKWTAERASYNADSTKQPENESFEGETGTKEKREQVQIQRHELHQLERSVFSSLFGPFSVPVPVFQMKLSKRFRKY